jgi:Domain of unknown function (DUF4365)
MKGKHEDNLPNTDDNEELNQITIQKFGAILPTDLFQYRGEFPDKGVDKWLEVKVKATSDNPKIAQSHTNYRCQVQLKGTYGQKINKDGSVSLADIDVSNLQYLLNFPTSIYFLYIEPRNEFRFVWTKGAQKSLNTQNPNWETQKTVTLRFYDILDAQKITEIHERIRKEGELHREVNNNLVFSDSQNVKFEVNSKTLEVTDLKKLAADIEQFGINFVNSGLGSQILEKIKLLEETSKRQIIKAYAEFSLGRYQTAKDTIAIIDESIELSDEDKQLSLFVENTCNLHTGKINMDQYQRALKEIHKLNPDSDVGTNLMINYLRQKVVKEVNLENRKKYLEEFRIAVKKIINGGVLKETECQLKWMVLEEEQNVISLEVFSELHKANLNFQLGFDVHLQIELVLSKLSSRSEICDIQRKELISETNNDLLKGSIYLSFGRYLFVLMQSMSCLSVMSTKQPITFQFKEQSFESVISILKDGLEIFSYLQNTQKETEVKEVLACIYSLAGKDHELQEIKSEVTRTADKMGYERLLSDIETLLPDKMKEIVAKLLDEDSDLKVAQQSDAEVENFAIHFQKSLELPDSRLNTIKKDCYFNREIAQERLNWCKHIQILQEMTHNQSKETMYLVSPEQFGYCEITRHKSLIGNTDAIAVISAFKEVYCLGCGSREPKMNNRTDTASSNLKI